MTCRLVCLLAFLLFSASQVAIAAVLEVAPKIDEYFNLVYPDGSEGRLRLPLVVVMSDADTVDAVLFPFAGDAEKASSEVQSVLEVIGGSRAPSREIVATEKERYREIVNGVARGQSLKFPLVAFVRVEGSLLSALDRESANHMDELEASLRNWVGSDPDSRGLLVVSVQPP